MLYKSKSVKKMRPSNFQLKEFHSQHIELKLCCNFDSKDCNEVKRVVDSELRSQESTDPIPENTNIPVVQCYLIDMARQAINRLYEGIQRLFDPENSVIDEHYPDPWEIDFQNLRTIFNDLSKNLDIRKVFEENTRVLQMPPGDERSDKLSKIESILKTYTALMSSLSKLLCRLKPNPETKELELRRGRLAENVLMVHAIMGLGHRQHPIIAHTHGIDRSQSHSSHPSHSVSPTIPSNRAQNIEQSQSFSLSPLASTLDASPTPDSFELLSEERMSVDFSMDELDEHRV